ncbi:MAG: thiamine phosphate synthase [Rhodospirillaceae bacterium]
MTADALACRLYLVTPAQLDPVTFATQLEAALDAGDVASVQLRLKNPDGSTADTGIITRACDLLRPLVQRRGVAFILNDCPKLAVATSCDGVHIGQRDGSCTEARRLLGPDGIVGVTCHDSRHLAMIAGEQGADYVAFGAFYPTNTHATPYRPDPEILRWWSELIEIPCVAIGGITPGNCAPLVRAGADFIAAVTAVWNHPDGPAAAVRAFNRAIADALRDLPVAEAERR